MMTLSANGNTEFSFFYKKLEPEEFDEKQEQIAAFVEEQSRLYEQALKDIIKKYNIAYQTDNIGRSIRHFRGLLYQAVEASVPLQVSIYPHDGKAVYSLKLDYVVFSIQERCVWKDFILYGSLMVYPEKPDSLFHISAKSSEMPIYIKVPSQCIDFSLANSGIFKDFLISSSVEVSTTNNENLVVIAKERCF